MDWQAVYEHLKAGEYEQVAEILLEAELAWEQTDEAVLVQLLAVACRVCLACSQSRSEVEWHRRARQEADQRERELRQQLYTTLKLISELELPETGTKPERPLSIPTIETPRLERCTLEAYQEPTLWQRIQAFFGWGRGLPSREREASSAFDKQMAPWPADRAEAPVAPPAVKAKSTLPQVDEEVAVLTPSRAERIKPPDASAVEEAVAQAIPLSDPEVKDVPMLSAEKTARREETAPSLLVYCLGPFRVYQDDQLVEDWPSSKGKCIFKYLVTHRERHIPKEVLMELFWPGAHPDAARNNLNVAIYGLRQALRQTRPSFSHVLFQDDCYLLNPDLQCWVDYEAFTEHFKDAQALERRGDPGAAMREYRAAEALYQGEFLEEDRYEDWLIPQRQRLQDDYLSLLERLSRYYFDREDYAVCVSVCHKMLVVDPCREEAHRRLMRCYSRQGQHYLALRQYHLCVEALKKELEVAPTTATTQLYEGIRRHQRG